jgi:hypothetical protein
MFVRTLLISGTLTFFAVGCGQELPTAPRLLSAEQGSAGAVGHARTRTVRPGWPICAGSAGLTKCSCDFAGTVVVFRADVEIEGAAHRLATKYGISDYSLHPWLGLYTADMGEQMVARIRCEPEVAWVKRFTYPSPSGDLVCAPCTAAL